jgi:hypothetical protein
MMDIKIAAKETAALITCGTTAQNWPKKPDSITC